MFNDKQREILEVLSADPSATNKEIADQLGISVKTVEMRMKQIYQKTRIYGGSGQNKYVRLLIALKWLKPRNERKLPNQEEK